MTQHSHSYPGSTEAGEVCDGCGKLLICRHCGKFCSASVAQNENVALRAELNKALRDIVDLRMPIGGDAQAAPMPDLLATTISYSYRTITIECGTLELRDDIYDWLMQKASALPSTQRLCTKCGSATKGEEAFVNGEIWCHPCADAITVPSTKLGDAS